MGYDGKYIPPKFARDRYMSVGGEKIKKGDISALFKDMNTQEINELIRFYMTTKKYGLPYEKGWREHPNIMIEVLQLFSELEEVNGNK